MKELLSNINSQIRHCQYCRLYETRTHAVCGEGIAPSKFMFIAQAPGRTEDAESKILVGPSGKVFDDLMCEVGLQREEIYITNLLKCFLPKCRKPRTDEINTCYHLYLKKEIELVKPEIIITLGYHVSKFIFKIYGLKIPTRIDFREAFGKLHISKNKKIVPVRHPATVVHKSKQFSKLVKDYSIIKTLHTECPLIDNCKQHKNFNQGLLPINFVKANCFGDWFSCKFYN
ncbi:MAG: uracil-DNA glycosylase [Bacteroidetes bacterium]|nr:uracil-DNA glycosylase [Bacteroidota bacterium]